MHRRHGLTLLELVIVLAIIGLLASLLFPAVQSARENARDAICKNNLHQMNLAVAGFYDVHKRLPAAPPAGKMGGWTVEILPFLEQANLAKEIVPGTAIQNAAANLLQPPNIMRCPNRNDQAGPQQTMSSAHYVLVPVARGESFMLFDAPVRLIEPWASGPEMGFDSIVKEVGPHHGGLFFTSGFQQGVGQYRNGQLVR